MGDMESANVVAMRRRLNALIRKAGIPESDPNAQSLVALLLKHISTKRDYEQLFGDDDGAEAFAKRNSLSPDHERIILEMQRVKDIFTPNPVLDWVLTIIFLAQVVLVIYFMFRFGYGPHFLVLLAVIDSIVHRVKHVSTVAGRAIGAFLVSRGLVDEDPLSGRVQMKKWQEQSWQLFVHTTFTVMEWMILAEVDWAWWKDPRTCWLPHPKDQEAIHSPLFRLFYMAQLAIWMYTCFIHRFVDERRKDYFVMYLHHVVTIALVGVSWGYGYWRIGLIVVYVHDISDIFVDALKMVNYLKLEGPRGYFGSEIAYATCVASWLYWRLWEYPFRVIKAGAYADTVVSLILGMALPSAQGAYVDTWALLSSYPASAGTPTLFGMPLRSPPDLPMYLETTTLLFVLQILHVYWFHLFAMIGYRILTESAREASRQEYEGDSDDGGQAPALGDAVPDEPAVAGNRAARGNRTATSSAAASGSGAGAAAEAEEAGSDEAEGSGSGPGSRSSSGSGARRRGGGAGSSKPDAAAAGSTGSSTGANGKRRGAS